MTQVQALDGKADLHIHTSHSDGMADVQQVLDHIETETDLDVVAITDHDEIRGSLAARESWARRRYRFELVTGVEVTAIEGHVIALFMEEPVRSLRPLDDVLIAIHRQGGFAIAPHPLNWLTRSVNGGTLERVAADEREGVYFDAIETANTSAASGLWVRRARRLNRATLGLPEVGGSDAHFLPAIGSAYTSFADRTAQDLRASLSSGSTRARRGTHPSLREIGPWQLARQTWRGLSTTPRTMGLGPTARSFVERIFSRP